MKRLEQLLLSSQLEKEELKQITGGKGAGCICTCSHGAGTWIYYDQSGNCPSMGWNGNICLDMEYTCKPAR